MGRHHLRYQRLDNAFVWLDDPSRSQRLADNMVRQNWVRVLDALARKANPLLRDLFRGSGYYWTISQCEYSTDVLFKDSASLQSLYKDLLQHATLCLSAEDVLTFLGKKLCSGFKGEVLTDFKHRKPGARVKHRVKTNWIKMYDKFGRVLRIETVIQHPYDFKIRRRGTENGKPVIGWFPTPDLELFRAVLRGFRNHDVRQRLYAATHDPARQRGQSARVSRQLKILNAHALIAKIPHSRRWRVTRKGHALMAATVKLATHDLPQTMAA